MKHSRHLLSLAFLLLATSWSLPTRAETIDCAAITSLPYTITTQGVYCLTGNLSTNMVSGHAIEITANNVTLDLNGWKVGGQAAGTATEATGIRSIANNITVKNGIVRGFATGIYLGGRGAVVQNLLVDKNTWNGIYVSSQGALVRHNKVVDTGGSTWPATGGHVYGIRVTASSLIESNLVSELTATGNGYEYAIAIQSTAAQSTVRGNVVNDSARPTGGDSYGIRIINTPSVGVRGNDVTNFDVGIEYFGTASGTYSRNVAIGCSTNYSGGTPGSGND